MNAMLWIRDPYPFRLSEREAIEEALRRTYTHSVVYIHEWPVDYVSIDGTNITTCKQMASTLKAMHLQQAYQDKQSVGREYCKNLEIVIQGRGDNRPDWANCN